MCARRGIGLHFWRTASCFSEPLWTQLHQSRSVSLGSRYILLVQLRSKRVSYKRHCIFTCDCFYKEEISLLIDSWSICITLKWCQSNCYYLFSIYHFTQRRNSLIMLLFLHLTGIPMTELAPSLPEA
jgi:hypothetical protein